jgi:hypothetical protein
MKGLFLNKMKKLSYLLLLLFVTCSGFAQVKIHSHNDYDQKQWFELAYYNKVYEIEADVFQNNGELLVAHTKTAINPINTLKKMYLNPIDSLFKLHQGKVSEERGYTFSLMIDFKTDWSVTYPILRQQIEQYGKIFDRAKNKLAVQIVISGNRPVDSTFHTYPTWLFFDGLPGIKYAKEDLKRITMISDNFRSYSKWNGIGSMPDADKAALKAVIDAAHDLKKPIRFWNAPDTEDCWRELAKLKVDIINTDKIRETKTYFEKYQNGF